MLRDSYLIMWHMFSHETMQQVCISEWDRMIQHPPAPSHMQQGTILSYCHEHPVTFSSVLALGPCMLTICATSVTKYHAEAL